MDEPLVRIKLSDEFMATLDSDEKVRQFERLMEEEANRAFFKLIDARAMGNTV